jgi:hypothetical protein
MIVQKALNHSWTEDSNPLWANNTKSDEQGSLTSLLIYDIFGGEILKTPEKEGWHFYNRIDGERIDFTRPEIIKSSDNIRFKDFPSSPDETYKYFEQEDYSTLFLRFIRAYEEAAGTEKFKC